MRSPFVHLTRLGADSLLASLSGPSSGMSKADRDLTLLALHESRTRSTTARHRSSPVRACKLSWGRPETSSRSARTVVPKPKVRASAAERTRRKGSCSSAYLRALGEAK